LEGLAAGGYNIWYDHGIEINTTWSDEIANAILASEIVVVFVSKNSMESTFVRAEVEFALGKGLRVVPVYLEGMDVLPTGLALAFHGTQGITSHDPEIIVSKLSKWLTKNVEQESWLPVKVAKSSNANVNVYHVMQEKNNISSEQEINRNSGVHATSYRPYMEKLLYIIFFVNATEILIAYAQWGIFQQPFFTALLTWGLTSVVFYWYFFCRYTIQKSFFDKLLFPYSETFKSVLYWSFLLGWLISSLNPEHFRIWVSFLGRGFVFVHHHLNFVPFIGQALEFGLYYLNHAHQMSGAWQQPPALIRLIAGFASMASAGILILDTVITTCMPFFKDTNNTGQQGS